MLCKLCLQSKKLINSHIIPESFFGKNTFLIAEDSPFKEKRPIGIYDKNILCAECDNFIGKKDVASFNLDDYEEIAKQIILNPSYDCDDFAVALCYLPNFTSPIHLLSPEKVLINDVNCYIFIIGYYKVIIKWGKGRFPDPLHTVSLSKENDILIIEGDFSTFPEKMILQNLVKKITKNLSKYRR